jgi:hypothetical protein
MLSLLFAYAELGDADLGRYVSFLESMTGRWFTRITHKAFLAALETPVEQATGRRLHGGPIKSALTLDDAHPRHDRAVARLWPWVRPPGRRPPPLPRRRARARPRNPISGGKRASVS